MNLYTKKVRVFITGDIHNLVESNRFSSSNFPEQNELTKDDIVIITGDAGIILDGGEHDKTALDICSKYNFTTAFIDGNHDNHDVLNSYPVEIWNGGKIHRISDSVIHLMRGQIYDINGKTFFTMGGAESVNKHILKEGENWWSREMPSQDEYREAFSNLIRRRYVVDYVITHCAPESAIGIERNGNKLTSFFDSLINEYQLQFNEWFCGHYHMDKGYGKIELVYESIINLGEVKIDAGYKDDPIFLLSSNGHSFYYKVIPDLNCWWWVLSPRGRRGSGVPWNGTSNDGAGFNDDDFGGIRPTIKYSNIKYKIIQSPNQKDVFYFNDHPFRIIDNESEIAIAEVPIAFDYFTEDEYEHSNIRIKLLKWFATGVWDYGLERVPDIKAGYKDDPIFLFSIYEFKHYILNPVVYFPNITFWVRECGGKKDNAGYHVKNAEFGYENVKNKFGVLPVIKYSGIKDIESKLFNGDSEFFFHNHKFLVIDRINKLARADWPIAFDFFDENTNEYANSSIRKKMLNWFETGIWENTSGGTQNE